MKIHTYVATNYKTANYITQDNYKNKTIENWYTQHYLGMIGDHTVAVFKIKHKTPLNKTNTK